MLKTLRKVRNDTTVDRKELDDTINLIGFDPYDLAKDALKSEITKDFPGDPAVRKIPIKATTIQRSKGLAAQYVFITHFDNRFFIEDRENKDNISDKDICKFLVALTRAERKVFLISSERKDPTLLTWIREERIERL